jgi:predicted transcriptional regulator of viral defense system
MELYDIGTPESRDRLRDRLTETYVNLDPLLPAEGKYLRKWRLRLNVSPDELLSTVRT